jgi:ssDNA-binding Zn-finger/Zn-ribbon topoisomerase 1
LTAIIQPLFLLETDCSACHINNTGANFTKMNAPYMERHHGDCWDCHQNHFARSAASLVSGTFSMAVYDPVNGSTTMTLSNYTVNDPSWTDPASWKEKTGGERGLVFWVRYLDGTDASFEIIESFVDSVTVNGELLGLTDNSFELMYGQMVAAVVAGKQVNFTGSITFADNDGLAGDLDLDGNADDSTVNGICQVCHTQTRYWRSDGTLATHNNDINCTTCHEHSQGFSPVGGSCDSCHGYPPSIGSNDSHNRHTQIGYTCDTCHFETTTDGLNVGPTHNNGIINVSAGPGATFPGRPADGDIALTFTYTYAPNGSTCSSISCHAYWGYSNSSSWVVNANVVVIAYLSARRSGGRIDFNATRASCYEKVNGTSEARICGYDWDFGGTGNVISMSGASLSESDHVFFQYDAPGTYTASLTMTESTTGKSDTKSVTVLF